MGNASINYIKYANPVSIADVRAIALKNDNINTINNAYKNSTLSDEVSGGTNKDLLSQNFGVGHANTPDSVTALNSEQVEQTMPDSGNTVPEQTISPLEGNAVATEPKVAVSPIPNNLNTNLEATPVNLNAENPTLDTVGTEAIAPFDPINNIESIVPDSTNNENEPLTINNIKPIDDTNANIDSSFKVTDKPNIFDQVPETSSNTNESVPNFLNDLDTNDLNIDQNLSNTFNNSISNDLDNSSQIDNSEIIELNERKIKLFEELANIYREENRILSSSNSDLEKTASDLFNNNGTLNENKVLDVQ